MLTTSWRGRKILAPRARKHESASLRRAVCVLCVGRVPRIGMGRYPLLLATVETVWCGADSRGARMRGDGAGGMCERVRCAWRLASHCRTAYELCWTMPRFVRVVLAWDASAALVRHCTVASE